MKKLDVQQEYLPDFVGITQKVKTNVNGFGKKIQSTEVVNIGNSNSNY